MKAGNTGPREIRDQVPIVSRAGYVRAGPFCFLLGDDGIGERPEAFDADGDGFARSEPAFRVATEAYAGWRPGRDDVARKQRGNGRKVLDQRWNVEDEFARVRVL